MMGKAKDAWEAAMDDTKLGKIWYPGPTLKDLSRSVKDLWKVFKLFKGIVQKVNKFSIFQNDFLFFRKTLRSPLMFTGSS